jgi:TetR/AcrR family transcriptional regulator, transcriptional repressor for nem operon
MLSEMTYSVKLDSEHTSDGRPGKRDRLIAAAARLLHQQGIEKTTLVDIAEAADVPAGNVYYYFKTKDDIVAAVIDAHAQEINSILAEITRAHRSPKARLKALIAEFASQSDLVAQYGCPLGSLCSELDKRAGNSDFGHATLMNLWIDWAEDQFRQMGRRDAHDLAVSLLASNQGSSLLTNTLRDPSIHTREARHLTRWIETL